MDRGRLGTRPLGRRVMLVFAASGFAAPRGARAGEAEWPSQAVRYINHFPPGGATDILSRIWCQKMSELTGQQFVVENRGGAGGTVGTTALARATPDGYTIGLASVAPIGIGPSLYPSLPYNAGRDFTFISGIWHLPNLLIANLNLPARTVPELIELLKRNPGRYSYGSGGSGTTPHLSGELLKRMTGVDIVHVPYRGGAPALIDLLGGRVQLMFDNIPTAIAAGREGKVRILAVTSPRRIAIAPDVPTMAEFLPGFEISSWGGVMGPLGIPQPMVARMSALTRRALEAPDLVRSFEEQGATPWWTTPTQFATFRAEQEALFARLIRASGARVD